MSEHGILLVWLEPFDASNAEFHEWRLGGGFLKDIPTASLYSVLKASDAIESHKPYRFQIAYMVDDVNAITSNTYEKALASKPAFLKSTEWHLYQQLISRFTPGVLTMPSGSVCVQVGQTPRDDPAAIQDVDAWFNEEHLPMLTLVPGWRVGRRARLLRRVGGENKEYAAPYVAMHRYLAENGLNGPEWQASVHTDWTKTVRDNMVKPNHRRVWEIEKEVTFRE